MSGSYRTLVVTDESKRLVEGFANVAVTDRQNDVVPTSAMMKAMLDYMKRGGILLLGHENKPVGKVLQWHVEHPEGSEAEGIHIIASIDEGTGIADAAWQMLKEKSITGFSIGGVAKDTKQIRDKSAAGGMARELSEIELNEISLVQIPANQFAVVEGLSMAKGLTPAHMDQDGRPIRKESARFTSTKREADAEARKLEEGGKVVHYVIQVGEDGEKNAYCITYTDTVNPANAQGKREEQHPTPAPKMERPEPEPKKLQSAHAIKALKEAGFIFKDEDAASGLMSVIPFLLDESGRPEHGKKEKMRNTEPMLPLVISVDGKPDEEKAEDSAGEHAIHLEQDGNYDNTKYGVQNIQSVDGKVEHEDPCTCGGKCACHKDADCAVAADAVGSSTAGVANTRYSDEQVEKPVRSKAQWGWLAANRPDLLHEWTHGEHGKQPAYSGLPEHKKEFDKPKADNVVGDDPRREKDNESEKVHGEDAFDRTDDYVAQEYHGDGTFADLRVRDIKAKAVGKDAASCEVCAGQATKKVGRHMTCEGCSSYPFEEKRSEGSNTNANVGQTGLGGSDGMMMAVGSGKHPAPKPKSPSADAGFKPAVGSEGHRTPSGWQGAESRGFRTVGGWKGRDYRAKLKSLLIGVAKAGPNKPGGKPMHKPQLNNQGGYNATRASGDKRPNKFRGTNVSRRAGARALSPTGPRGMTGKKSMRKLLVGIAKLGPVDHAKIEQRRAEHAQSVAAPAARETRRFVRQGKQSNTPRSQSNKEVE